MNWRWSALLVALTAGSCTIPVDFKGAQSIPTEIAVSKLQELLPKAFYVSCLDPNVSIDQYDIRG